MHDFLIGAAILIALLLLDVCAQHWGVDSRFDFERRERHADWWF